MAIDCVAFCKALADDTGQRNLGMLLEGARSAGDIVDATDASQPTISYHLNIPKQCGLVISRKEASRYSTPSIATTWLNAAVNS